MRAARSSGGRWKGSATSSTSRLRSSSRGRSRASRSIERLVPWKRRTSRPESVHRVRSAQVDQDLVELAVEEHEAQQLTVTRSGAADEMAEQPEVGESAAHARVAARKHAVGSFPDEGGIRRTE